MFTGKYNSYSYTVNYSLLRDTEKLGLFYAEVAATFWNLKNISGVESLDFM